MQNYQAPASLNAARGEVTITSYEIDHDWIKTIRKNHRPTMKW